MSPELTRLDLEAALGSRGSSHTGFLEMSRNGGSDSARLPVAVVTGARRGPTVWVNASIHGDEYLGTAAIARLLSGLEVDRLRGSVVATPVLNVPAFRGMRRTSPSHDIDFNRAWAGEPSPGETTDTRDVVTAEILERADIVIDLHSGGNRYLQAPFSVYPRAGGTAEAASNALAKACGLPLIWADGTKLLEGALIHAAARRGKPAVLIEIAGEGKAEEHWVVRMVAAVRGALARAKVLAEPPRYLEEYRVFDDLATVRNEAEGLWARKAEPMEDVGANAVLGRVLGAFGEELEVVRSPREAVVLGMYTYGYVRTKELIAELGHGFHSEGGPA